MAQAKNQKGTKTKELVKSAAWLIEASFRIFVGWLILSNFHEYITTAVALFALATGGLIIVSHFFKAHA